MGFMGGGIAIIIGLVYIAVIVYLLTLAARFVEATEKMSDSIGKIAEKFER